jgi:hypothetical protein
MLSVGLCRALLYILEMVNGNESMLGLRGLFCGFSFVYDRKSGTVVVVNSYCTFFALPKTRPRWNGRRPPTLYIYHTCCNIMETSCQLIWFLNSKLRFEVDYDEP